MIRKTRKAGWFNRQKNSRNPKSIRIAANFFAKLDNRYFFSLRAFRAAAQFELYVLAFVQRFVVIAGGQDVSEMYENIGALFLFDKAKAFVCVKPFNDTGCHCSSRHEKSPIKV